METPIFKAILEACTHTQLTPELIIAIIHQESTGNVYSIRNEDGFFLKYLEKKNRKNIGGKVPAEGLCSFMTEKRLRACSFGLMHVMGQTAREHGFDGLFLTELLEPKTNITFGTKILRHFLDDAGGDLDKGLLRWNGGGDKLYPGKIRRHMDAGTGDYMRFR